MITHTRSLYGIFDILGELAGVTSVISSIFIFVLCPLSELKFYQNAIMKMIKFKIKKENPLFKISKKQERFL
jgi:hypothetical protein